MTTDSSQNDDKLAAAVKAMEDLVNEAVQVYEMDREKTNVIDDLYNSLKIITSYLGFTIDLQPSILNLPEQTRVMLTPFLDILVIKSNFKTEQKRFDQLTLDETSEVIRYAIPTMIRMAESDRIIKSKKIAFLREGTQKLKRLPATNAEDMIITDTTVHMEKVV